MPTSVAPSSFSTSHSYSSAALPPPPVSEVLASPEPLGISAVQLENGVPAVLPSSPVWYYLRGVLSGTASGVTKLVVGHPFDTIKVRMQTEGGYGRFKGPLDCFQQTVKLEGLRGLYKGGTPPLVGWGIIDSLMWGSLIQYRNILHSLQADPTQPLSIPAHFLAGGAAGVTSVVVVTPIEQVKARLQIQYHDPASIQYRGPIDCVRQLWRNNGIRGLYGGVAGTALFRCQMSIYFGMYEWFRRYLSRQSWSAQWSETAVSFVSGGMAANSLLTQFASPFPALLPVLCMITGIGLWLVAFPSDTIKNRMMSQKDVKPRKYPTVRYCAQYIYRTEGMTGLYRGFVPCLLRSFPTNGAAFVAAETMLKILPQ